VSDETITLAAGAARLRVVPRGAEARAWRVGEVELLWPGDPAIWDQVSPILYPVVGWTRDGAVRVGDRRYPLAVHGFAAAQDFVVEAAGGDFARLTLGDNSATRALYPFAFALAVEYRLGETTLEIALEVGNSGGAPAPYACGVHPGFRWPFAAAKRDGAVARFEKDEPAEVPAIAPGGMVSRRKRPIPLRGRTLALSDALFADDALCFLEPASRSLSFEQADGSAIAIDFSGFGLTALWTRPGAPFLCLEAWTGYSDPEGFAGDLFDKPSMRVLQPGERARHVATYTFLAAVGR
jgi:galactose mutarotase-like enzyme